jgi:hypothetical protein
MYSHSYAPPSPTADCCPATPPAELALTGVAVLLALEVVGDAKEGAVTLAAGVLDVPPALGLHPGKQDELSRQQGA